MSALAIPRVEDTNEAISNPTNLCATNSPDKWNANPLLQQRKLDKGFNLNHCATPTEHSTQIQQQQQQQQQQQEAQFQGFQTPQNASQTPEEFLRHIHRGGYGSVDLVRCGTRLLVRKTLHPHTGGYQSVNTIFEREWRMLRNLRHPHIVSYEHHSLTDGMKIYMELCGGGDLFDAIQERRQMNRPFTEPEICWWLLQLVSALRYLHHPNLRTTCTNLPAIVYRDLKPENIVFTCRDRITLKLCDFGAARCVSQSDRWMTCIGSHPYMAPEIRRHAARSDHTNQASPTQDAVYGSKPTLGNLHEQRKHANNGKVAPANLYSPGMSEAEIADIAYLADLGNDAHHDHMTGAPFDTKVDMFSLGCILVVLMTMRSTSDLANCAAFAHSFDPSVYVRPAVCKLPYSANLVALVADLLQRDPTKRPDAASLYTLPWLRMSSVHITPTRARSEPAMTPVNPDARRSSVMQSLRSWLSWSK